MLILLCLNPSAHANLFNIQTTAKMNSLKNVAYGHHPEQIMDIYFPSKPLAEKQPAPSIIDYFLMQRYNNKLKMSQQH